MDNKTTASKRLLPPGVEWSSKPGGNCPVQGEGVWLGREIYFRARGDAWSLSVAKGVGWNGHGAGAPLGNSGWMGRDEADELARMHLWAWSWQERGLETGSAQGALCKAMRLLDAGQARMALSAGADPRIALEPGGPLPMAMALALSDKESAKPKDSQDGIPDGLAWLNDPKRMAVWDEARAEKRALCVEALLAAGASPDDAGTAWTLRPIHWAAILPTGQKSMEAGRGMACVAFGSEALAAQRLDEAGRARSNPWFALVHAGADAAARIGGDGADALDLAMGCQAMELAEAMAGILGVQAMERVSKSWIQMAGIEAMLARMGGSEDEPAINPFGGEAFLRLMSEFGSGRWPLEWLEGGDGRADASEAAGEARERLLAIAQARQLDKVAALSSRTGPSGRL